jgi:hypothetical protein
MTKPTLRIVEEAVARCWFWNVALADGTLAIIDRKPPEPGGLVLQR